MVKKIMSVVATLTTTGALMFAGTAVAAPLSDAPSNTGPYTNETIHTQVNTAEGARGSLAVLPDTQFYSRYVAEGDMFAACYGENVPDPFASQTTWIADNTDKFNIAMTQHVGDVVDRSNREGEWETASAAIKNLEDAQLPYAIIPGNHDSEGWQTWPAVGVWDSYLRHFPIERQAQSPSFTGAGSPSGAANYHEFNIGGFASSEPRWRSTTSVSLMTLASLTSQGQLTIHGQVASCPAASEGNRLVQLPHCPAEICSD
ncbi:hypothetical protein J2S70_001727 [Trueperella bonasi]|uniref:Calcineurin-like phosphoesterase domain-containing protein n=1 Tax=Trueperella bonasi TaxID=312286 RepID=A0ABT9NIE1_9ACTO|nr:metallophosphoesterase [Trueperella bonasi]MDP9807145.1 hypothetical protein [Trueperella bonasi]